MTWKLLRKKQCLDRSLQQSTLILVTPDCVVSWKDRVFVRYLSLGTQVGDCPLLVYLELELISLRQNV